MEVGLYGVNPTPYIVLEYLQGRDISTELRRLGSLPARDAIRFTLEACDAMEEAHRKGIVHRALKPSSLFLHQQEQQLLPQLKVLNFGCAPKTGVDTTNLPLDYRSPEQLRPTGEVNCQTDIWSLGVILHQMVQGELPYSSDSKQQLLEAIAAGERSLLTERNANLAALEGVVSRCLEQDPEHRYCSIPDLKAALRRCREEAHHQVKPCPQSVAVQEIVPAALQATVQALAPTEEPTHRLASSTVTNCPKYGSAHAQLPVKTVAVVTRSLQPECKDDTAGHPIP